MSKRLEHDWFPQNIPENVFIGKRSWLYSSFAFIHYKSLKEKGLIIGNNTGLYNGTFFEISEKGSVEIGDYCSLVGVIISTNNSVKIGDYTFMAHEVVIADNFIAMPFETKKNEFDSDIIIGENVWIGAKAILLGGSKIGKSSIIGAAAVVDFEVPPYSLVAGNPAKIKGRIKF